MKRYHQFDYTGLDAVRMELLSGLLSAISYEGVEEGDDSLRVFVEAQQLDRDMMQFIAQQIDSTPTETVVEDRNWNSLWESNFEPICVDDFVAVRAGFHSPIPGVQHEIVITPKMSFGTGHHPTTWLMIQAMQHLSFHGSTVLDFGTGTGILAILALRLGAASVTALDNDEWSISNAIENAQTNDASAIQLRLASDAGTGEHYDIILANINKNVILSNLPRLAIQLKPRGTLLVSGLLRSDAPDILRSATLHGLKTEQEVARDNWLCMRLSHA